MDVYTDSQVLIGSWRYQGSKSRDLADDFKRIFGIVSTYNIHLNLFYISSADNPADTPSRVFPLQDSKHSPSAWVQVLWMVPPFLSFPHIPLLALLRSICLPSVLIIMVAFFQTPMFFPPLFLSHRFCALSKLTVFLALLLFPMSGLVNFGGLFFNRILFSCWRPRVLRA